MTPIIIYHANCRDGMCAAMVAHEFLTDYDRHYPEPELMAAQYGDAVDGLALAHRDVYIVDFSYPPHVLEDICNYANRVIVLDHHQSAIDRISGLELDNLEMVLDITRSGAQITWDYFIEHGFTCVDEMEEFHKSRNQRPMIVEYVADRDLWKWEYSNSKSINEALAMYYPTVGHWVRGATDLFDDRFTRVTLSEKGGILLDRMRADVERLANYAQIVTLAKTDFEVVLCNSPLHQSELGNHLAAKYGLPAVIWYDNGEQHVFSARSMDSIDQDARAIAEHFGGGGHRNAAGFALSYENSII